MLLGTKDEYSGYLPGEVRLTIHGGGKSTSLDESNPTPVEKDNHLRIEVSVDDLNKVDPKHLASTTTARISGKGRVVRHAPDCLWDMPRLRTLGLEGEAVLLDALRRGIPKSVKFLIASVIRAEVKRFTASESVRYLDIMGREGFFYFSPDVFPNLKGLHAQFGTRKHKSDRQRTLEQIERLENLEALIMSPADHQMSFDMLPKSIKRLCIWPSNFHDLKCLASISQVTELSIQHSPKLSSLSGIEALENLEIFRLGGAAYRGSLEELLVLPNLECVDIASYCQNDPNTTSRLKENGVRFDKK